VSGGLWLLIGSGGAIAAWIWLTRARERVDLISREVCSDLRVQRLDESVALRRVSLRRAERGIQLRRVFSFEFSTDGVDRRRGDVCLLGSKAMPAWVRIDHPDGVIFIDLESSS
jgi:hypothetical protein